MAFELFEKLRKFEFKTLQQLKERKYSYYVISRYFALRHLGRLLLQRQEVMSEFRLGVVGRESYLI